MTSNVGGVPSGGGEALDDARLMIPLLADKTFSRIVAPIKNPARPMAGTPDSKDPT